MCVLIGTGGSSDEVLSAVRDHVASVFAAARNDKELEVIASEVQLRISEGGRGVDIPFWEAVSYL